MPFVFMGGVTGFWWWWRWWFHQPGERGGLPQNHLPGGSQIIRASSADFLEKSQNGLQARHRHRNVRDEKKSFAVIWRFFFTEMCLTLAAGRGL